ncbi:MAG: PQQ-binding-like beta-propeller repeat protein [Planctomycetota bacterium]
MKSCKKYLKYLKVKRMKLFFFKVSIIVIAIKAITYSKVYIVCAHGINESWSVFRHDSLHTGRSTLQVTGNHNLKWSFHTGNSVDSSPVLDHNGTIYIGSQDKSFMQLNRMGFCNRLSRLMAL